MAIANMGTRHLAHRRHVEQAKEGDAVEQYGPHTVTNFGLALLSFLFAVHQPTGGTILSFLVVTMIIADLFEFEARNVEARNDMTVEAPKSAIVTSGLVLLYASYYSLFFLVEGFWNQAIVA